MNSRFNQLAGAVVGFSVFLGCGDGHHGGFDSLTGNWRINSLDNISTSGCTDGTGGFSSVLFVEQNGDTLTATGAPETTSTWTGHPTDDGFEIVLEKNITCENGNTGKEILHLTISAIVDPLNDAYGDAAYSYEADCGDNTPKCLLRSNGLTKHISN